MTIVTLDSNNLEQIIAHATGETDAPLAKPEEKKEEKSDEPKVEDKSESPQEDPAPIEDEEDENGLTNKERDEWTHAMQKKIGKKHRALKEAEEFAAAQYREKIQAENRIAELQRQIEELGNKNKPKQAESKEPAREDFVTDTDYIKAMVDYQTEQRIQKLEAQREAQAILNTAKLRVDKARELIPDFDEVLQDGDAKVPAAISAYLQKSDMIAELAYHFAKNPKALDSLRQLDDASQLVALGKIEAKLEPFGQKTKETKEAPHSVQATSKKPSSGDTKTPSDEAAAKQSIPTRTTAPVITPLSVAAGVAHEKDFADMNTREVIQTWQRQNKANLNLRKRH